MLGAPSSTTDAPQVVEVRVLDGPNRHLPRPAIQVAITGSVPAERLRRLVAEVAEAAGWPNLPVRVDARDGGAYVAFPFRTEGTGEALGRAVGDLLPYLDADDLTARVRAAGDAVHAVDPGPRPHVPVPHVPTVVVTGTNGKTTVTRMVAHLAMTAVSGGWGAGGTVAWSSTDGVVVDGRIVDPGDWSGFGGAGRVLAEPDLALAVLEVARGGLLRRGIGTAHADVAVVTNVGADHLGMDGVQTLDQLAEVKAAVTRIVRPTGWCVLNAEDERVVRMRGGTPGGVWGFALDPAAPGLGAIQAEGGRAATVVDGWLTVVVDGRADPLLPVGDLPAALGGVARINVANALAAAAAALGAGVPRDAVVHGLATFTPDALLSAGRMNCYDLAGATVIVDLAHNVEGMESLLDVAEALRSSGARILLALGLAGDRTDDLLVQAGQLAGARADVVHLVHKQRYLRGRDADELEVLLTRGVHEAGNVVGAVHADEQTGFQVLLDLAASGDAVALMCHTDVDAMPARLAARGGTPLSAAEVGARRDRRPAGGG